MKLAKLPNQSSKYKSLRNRTVFQIQGSEEQADLIERLDTAIGAVIKCYDGANKPLTWQQECSGIAVDYCWGTGCRWFIDNDDVEEFKSLWKKFKKEIK